MLIKHKGALDCTGWDHSDETTRVMQLDKTAQHCGIYSLEHSGCDPLCF